MQPSDDKAEKEFFTLGEVEARGWSPKLIETVLGTPDKTARNPVYATAAPVKLWARARVEAAESSSPAFAAYQPRRAALSTRSQQAADRKRAEAQRRADELAAHEAVCNPPSEGYVTGPRAPLRAMCDRRMRMRGIISTDNGGYVLPDVVDAASGEVLADWVTLVIGKWAGGFRVGDTIEFTCLVEESSRPPHMFQLRDVAAAEIVVYGPIVRMMPDDSIRGG